MSIPFGSCRLHGGCGQVVDRTERGKTGEDRGDRHQPGQTRRSDFPGPSQPLELLGTMGLRRDSE